jgi:hypothetical protein
MGDEGLEQGAELPGNTEVSQTDDAKSDAFSADSGLIDSDLAIVIGGWPTLPKSVRDLVLTFVSQSLTN